MIEKITNQNQIARHKLADKINELVDAVNELQLAKDVVFNRIDMLNNAICDMRNAAEKATISKMENVDPYAELCGALQIKDLQNSVNELQLSIKPILEERESELKVCEEALDMYKNRNVKQAEKWMYRLCRFWNDGCDCYYGELVNIDTRMSSEAPFERDTGDWYECCEPVKPDDDIIYKGE